MNKLAVGLLSCCNKDYYFSQIRACEKTWCADLDQIFYFSGEKCSEQCNDKVIHLENVSDDISSATYKQWYGLQWMYINSPAKWYYLAGTDTYAKIDKISTFLKDLDSNKYYYIGGDGMTKNDTGKEIYYHSGGSGFILSNSLMSKIYDIIPEWIEKWNLQPEWIRDAADWSVAALFEYYNIPIITIKSDKFKACNWKGYTKGGKICCNNVNSNDIWVCHYMEPKDMFEFHDYLHHKGNFIKLNQMDRFKSFLDIVETNYRNKCNTYSDIFEHLPTISSYAEKCNTVTEFGMRSVISTWTMLYGLTRNDFISQNKRLVSVDLNYSPNIEQIKDLCNSLKIDFYFVMGNDIKINIENTDLLFIDTWHIYGHLKRELEIHHSKVNKYIILHDTTIDAELGETIRNGWNPIQQSEETGYPVEEITKGLWPAVEEFLEKHSEWKLEKRYTNNNGLTILSKI